VSQVAKRRPRTWVLWVLRAELALTILIGSIWLGPAHGTFWWLILGLPQLSSALLAVLICWAPDSRPEGLGIHVGLFVSFGTMLAIIFLKWPLLVIGVLAIVAMCVRPRGKLVILESPPTAGGPRL